MDAVTRYVAAVMRDDRYTEPRFVAWVDQAIAEMRDCLDDQGLHLDGEGVAPAALVVLRYLRLLRNVEARLAWLRRGEAQVQQELAGCLDPDRQTDLKRRLDLVRDEITRTEGLLR